MATSHIIDLNGPFHFMDYGGDGPPMVLVHGLGGSYLNWWYVADELTKRHRVYAVDLVGFGLTPAIERKASVFVNQGVIDTFSRHIAPDERVILIGNSMGGLISMMQANENPDRVAGLVLLNPALPPRSMGGVNLFTFQRLAVPALPGVGEAALRRYYATTTPEEQLEQTMELIASDRSHITEEAWIANVEMLRLRREMEWAIPSFTAASRSIARVITNRRAFKRMVHRISCPVLLIHGADDHIVDPPAAEWAAAERPDWEFHLLPNVGHVPQIEVPATVVELFTDWSRRELSRRAER
jgi:pimeloyl-ACP methyl ester carboxylesterase